MTTPTIDEVAARVALSTLTGVGPARLRWLTSVHDAVAALDELRRGRGGPPGARLPPGVDPAMLHTWRTEARACDPDRLLAAHQRAGIDIMTPADADWPFADDPEPPVVLYLRGRRSALTTEHRVAIVGTRRCTSMGRSIAAEFGAALADRGVGVVSGLALGIDGAAHEGVIGAVAAARPGTSPGPPVAVVAHGLDHISPPSHRRLAASVADHGVIVSEWPVGTVGDRWRFPARNRLIAGLTELVVVVESHARGGALITADEAIERSIPVMAVPGSVRSAASVGTNRLLADGAAPLCVVDDLVTALALQSGRSDPTPRSAPTAPDSTDPDPVAAAILGEIGVGPVSIDRLALTTGHPLDSLLTAIHRLAVAGRLRQVGSTVMLA